MAYDRDHRPNGPAILFIAFRFLAGFFAYLAFVGPAAVGPAIGGFTGASGVVSRRWVDWVTLIWSGLIFGAMFLFLPETYAPVLLKWKAEHLRSMTSDSEYKSVVEVRDTKFWGRMRHAMYRPWVLMIFEPTIQLFTPYMTVVYIVLFAFLTGFPSIFRESYNLSPGITFLIFVGLGVGFTFTPPLVPFITSRYRHKLAVIISQGQHQTGAGTTPADGHGRSLGRFWMAWTTNPHNSVWSPVLSLRAHRLRHPGHPHRHLPVRDRQLRGDSPPLVWSG